jgi:hypothetical protein
MALRREPGLPKDTSRLSSVGCAMPARLYCCLSERIPTYTLAMIYRTGISVVGKLAARRVQTERTGDLATYVGGRNPMADHRPGWSVTICSVILLS